MVLWRDGSAGDSSQSSLIPFLWAFVVYRSSSIINLPKYELALYGQEIR